MSTESKEIEQVKINLKDKILDMFDNNKSITNKEFTKAGIGRFGATINILRNEGYIIEKKFIPNADGTYVYTLKGKEAPPKKLSAIDSLKTVLKNKGYENIAETIKDLLVEANVSIRNNPQH